ncbi:MAG: hypothetical protein ACJ77U_11430 [Chloroflexota bacterium]
MADHPRRARSSRLDSVNWPSGTGIVLVAVWVAYAVASAIWVHALLWTVLPSGLTLFLIAERYPWTVVVLLVVPLTLLTLVAQGLATWSEAPTSLAFATYLVACAYFSSVLCMPDRDRFVGQLPVRFLGERFAARVSWSRFEESLVAANAAVRQLQVPEAQGDTRAVMAELARDARRASDRGGIWQGAWTAYATWLEALGLVAGSSGSREQARHIHDLLAGLDRAHMLAVERTTAIDPARSS